MYKLNIFYGRSKYITGHWSQVTVCTGYVQNQKMWSRYCRFVGLPTARTRKVKNRNSGNINSIKALCDLVEINPFSEQPRWHCVMLITIVITRKSTSDYSCAVRQLGSHQQTREILVEFPLGGALRLLRMAFGRFFFFYEWHYSYSVFNGLTINYVKCSALI